MLHFLQFRIRIVNQSIWLNKKMKIDEILRVSNATRRRDENRSRRSFFLGKKYEKISYRHRRWKFGVSGKRVAIATGIWRREKREGHDFACWLHHLAAKPRPIGDEIEWRSTFLDKKWLMYQSDELQGVEQRNENEACLLNDPNVLYKKAVCMWKRAATLVMVYIQPNNLRYM